MPRTVDLSQTPSGRWLASLTFRKPKAGQLALVAYLRLSVAKLSPEDHLLALQRQLSACEALAKKLGGVVVAVFCDMARSADTRKGSRPEFQRMLLALPAQDGLVTARFDRMARDPEDVVPLCRLFEQNPHLRFATPRETFDLSTTRGRERAYGAATAGLGELAEMSERQEGRHAQLREAGRYVGPEMFGVDGENRDRLNKREAKLIRQAAEDILAGKSFWEVSREWERKGVVGRKGEAMSKGVIRNMLLSPRMVGLLVHKPKRKKGEPALPIWECFYRSEETGLPVYSQVPAILTEETWRALIAEQGVRGDRQKPRQNNRASYLLTSTCWGARCGDPMNGQFVKRAHGHVYRCPKGCCVVKGEHLDTFVKSVLRHVWEVQSLPEADMDQEPFPGAEDLAYWEKEKADTDALYRARRLTIGEKAEALAVINENLTPLLKAYGEWKSAQAMASAPRHTWEDFEAADLDGQRRMVRLDIQRLEISPGVRGQKGYNEARMEARVNIVWRSDDGASSDGGATEQEPTEPDA